MPVHVWLADIPYDNGARLADMGGERLLRSPAVPEMMRRRIERGKRLRPMGFQTHAALLVYWRERRGRVHELRATLHGPEAQRVAWMIRSVEQLVRWLGLN